MSISIEYSATTVEAIATMHTAVQAAEQARLDGKPYAGKGEAMDTAKDAVNKANKAIMGDAVKHLADLASTDVDAFIQSYWTDWTVDGFKLVQDDADKGGNIHTDGKTLRILYSAIDSASKTKVTSNGEWRKYLQIYGDNCMAFIADNDKGDSAASVKTALPADLIAKRKELGGHWLKHSHSALVQQLNDLATMVFPEGKKPDFRMVSVDQKVVTASLTRAKRIDANAAATLQMANLKTLEAILFTEIYTRMNNLAINLETGLKEKDQQQGQPQNSEAKGGDVSAPAKEQPKMESKTTSKSSAKTISKTAA